VPCYDGRILAAPRKTQDHFFTVNEIIAGLI